MFNVSRLKKITLPLLVVIAIGLVLFQLLKHPTPPSSSSIPSPTPNPDTPQTSQINLAKPQLTSQNRSFGLNSASQLTEFISGSQIILHPDPIYKFFPSGDQLFAISQNRQQIFQFDLNSQSAPKIHNLKAYSPLLSLALSPDNKTVYFMGKYNSKTFTSTVYKTGSSFSKPQPISTTTHSGNDLLFLNPELLAIVHRGEDANSNYLKLIQPTDGKPIKAIPANQFALSPKQDFLATTTNNQVVFYRISKDLITPHIPTNLLKISFIFWKDDSTLGILANSDSGTLLTEASPLSQTIIRTYQIPELSNNGVRSLLSSNQDRILVLDQNDQILSINLE